MDVFSPSGARHPGRTLIAVTSQKRKKHKDSP